MLSTIKCIPFVMSLRLHTLGKHAITKGEKKEWLVIQGRDLWKFYTHGYPMGNNYISNYKNKSYIFHTCLRQGFFPISGHDFFVIYFSCSRERKYSLVLNRHIILHDGGLNCQASAICRKIFFIIFTFEINANR